MFPIKISIIIPALNEEKTLGRTIRSLNMTGNEDLIVVDGGSTDDTMAIALEFTDKVFSTEKGRGRQMNFGAERAAGDILLFLHADCILPQNGFEMVRRTLADHNVSAGAFDLSIEHAGLRFRIIEFGANLRSRLTSIPYGDQGLFVRKSVFRTLGGFADIPLMEDIELSARLKKMGKIIFVRPPVRTLPRRWLKEGALYMTLRDWSLAISYSLFGASPERLAKYYRDIR